MRLEILKHLPHLSNHLNLFTISFIGCSLVEWMGGWVFKPIEGIYNKEKKQFNCHLVALLHSILVIAPCLYLYHLEPLDRYQIFSYNSLVGQLHAVSMGYFLWDSITSIQLHDIPFTLHGLACFSMMLLSFQPFLMNFGYKFLLFELSTPFVNVNWFMDRIPGWKGGYLWYFNGISLILTFFVARIVIGTHLVWQMIESMTYNRYYLSTPTILTYICGTITLSTLNYYWFYLMLKKVKRVLSK